MHTGDECQYVCISITTDVDSIYLPTHLSVVHTEMVEFVRVSVRSVYIYSLYNGGRAIIMIEMYLNNCSIKERRPTCGSNNVEGMSPSLHTTHSLNPLAHSVRPSGHSERMKTASGVDNNCKKYSQFLITKVIKTESFPIISNSHLLLVGVKF